MNGVRRGGAHEQVSRSVRCSWRFARLRDNPSATFGFRLNGVNRGGSYTQYNLVYMYRSGGLRQQYVRSHPLGFRLTF